MARVSRVFPHLSVEEVKQKLAAAKKFWQQQRWWIIYQGLVDPREAQVIALHSGTSVWSVHQVISKYNRCGVAAIETPGKGGRRNSYLSWEQEQQFLTPFFQQAAAGEIATAAVIQQAFEERVGEVVDPSTIYRLLQRHNWHKLVPRPRHPQAEPQEQEAFKQTSPNRSSMPCKRETRKTPGHC